jgi:fructose-1,6-bisphosphatase I
LHVERIGRSPTDGHGRILDIKPSSLHQRTPLAVGSRKEMGLLAEVLQSTPEH